MELAKSVGILFCQVSSFLCYHLTIFFACAGRLSPDLVPVRKGRSPSMRRVAGLNANGYESQSLPREFRQHSILMPSSSVRKYTRSRYEDPYAQEGAMKAHEFRREHLDRTRVDPRYPGFGGVTSSKPSPSVELGKLTNLALSDLQGLTRFLKKK